MDWFDFLKYALSSTLFVGAISYISKSAITLLFNKDLEKYKINLTSQLEIHKLELNKQLENIKAELARINLEHSVRFNKLHEKRMETIVELYKKTYELNTSLDSSLSIVQMADDPSLPEKLQIVADNYNITYPFYYTNKLFFENSTCILMENYLTKIKDIFIDVTSYPLENDSIEYRYNFNLLKEKREVMNKSRETFKSQITAIQKELEDKFRALLGVS